MGAKEFINKWAMWTAITAAGMTAGAIIASFLLNSIRFIFANGWWQNDSGGFGLEVTNIGIFFLFLKGAPVAEAFIFNMIASVIIGITLGIFQGMVIRKRNIPLFYWILDNSCRHNRLY